MALDIETQPADTRIEFVGWYRMRLVKGGPFVPALIYKPCPFVIPHPDTDPEEWCTETDSNWRLKAMIGLNPIDVDRVVFGGKRVTREEYLYRMDVRHWAMTHAPEAPEAHPKTPIDLSARPPLF